MAMSGLNQWWGRMQQQNRRPPQPFQLGLGDFFNAFAPGGTSAREMMNSQAQNAFGGGSVSNVSQSQRQLPGGPRPQPSMPQSPMAPQIPANATAATPGWNPAASGPFLGTAEQAMQLAPNGVYAQPAQAQPAAMQNQTANQWQRYPSGHWFRRGANGAMEFKPPGWSPG